MNILRAVGTALACTTLVLGVSACGGGSDRPSQEEIAASFTGDDALVPVPEAAADCVAKVFYESDLSDKTLRALVDQDKDYKGSDADEKVMTSLTSTMVSECSEELGASE